MLEWLKRLLKREVDKPKPAPVVTEKIDTLIEESERLSERAEVISREVEVSKREITSLTRFKPISKTKLSRMQARRLNLERERGAGHNVGRFFEGKGKGHLPHYRRSVKARIEPEDKRKSP